MKKMFGVLLVLIGAIACQNENSESPLTNEIRDVSAIGKRITQQQGVAWTAEYQRQNPEATWGFLFGKRILTRLLENDGAEGIWLMRGINDEGSLKLVLYSADEAGEVLTKSNIRANGDTTIDPADDGKDCPPGCPISGGGRLANREVEKIGKQITWDTGAEWVSRFRSENPDSQYGMLYGKEMIMDLLSPDKVEGIWFYFGINEKNEEVMVLYSADQNGNHWGTSASGAARSNGDDVFEPADDGEDCPPNCPKVP
ncbi:MAG: hypothetical protein Tsb0034_29460 [Ekhidna sp.]